MTEKHDLSAGDVLDLIEVTFVVAVVYVVFLAPATILRGEANRRLDYAAGTLGLAIWAIMVLTVSEGFA